MIRYDILLIQYNIFSGLYRKEMRDSFPVSIGFPFFFNSVLHNIVYWSSFIKRLKN